MVRDTSAETLLALNRQAGVDHTVLVQGYGALTDGVPRMPHRARVQRRATRTRRILGSVRGNAKRAAVPGADGGTRINVKVVRDA